MTYERLRETPTAIDMRTCLGSPAVAGTHAGCASAHTKYKNDNCVCAEHSANVKCKNYRQSTEPPAGEPVRGLRELMRVCESFGHVSRGF